jgi:hypothetical protein
MRILKSKSLSCSSSKPFASAVLHPSHSLQLFFIQAIRFSCSSFKPFASAVLYPSHLLQLFFIQAIRFCCSSSKPFASAVLHPRDSRVLVAKSHYSVQIDHLDQ